MSWKSTQLSNVADVFNGKTPSKSEQRDEGHPVLKIKDVDEGGAFKGSFASFVDPGLASKFENKRLKLDDSLILNAAHNSDYVGSKQYRAESSVIDALPTGEWLVARANGKNLLPRYLNYWLASPQARFQIKQLVKGIHLYPKDVARLDIPVPPLKEQKRIIAILGKTDTIRRKRQQAIQLADEFLRAVFLDMFGDPVTNPMSLTTNHVDDFCNIVRGSSPRPKGDSKYYGGPIPRLMVQDLTRDGWYVTPKIDSLTLEGAKKSRPIDAGTVVMAVSGNVGLTSILQIDACIHDGFVAFKDLDEKKILPEYLLYVMTLLKSTHSSREAGAIFKNLTTTQIKEMEIPVPDIDRQKKFIKIVKKFFQARNTFGKLSKGLNGLFNSISQKAFNSEL